jgi:hypothetical protein
LSPEISRPTTSQNIHLFRKYDVSRDTFVPETLLCYQK